MPGEEGHNTEKKILPGGRQGPREPKAEPEASAIAEPMDPMWSSPVPDSGAKGHNNPTKINF